MVTTYYTRNLDAGNCRQNITVENGIITEQTLAARQGSYTGDGNPELVGKNASALRGMGFKKVKGPQHFNSFSGKWHSTEPSYAMEEDE